MLQCGLVKAKEREEARPQKATHCRVPLIWNVQDRPIHTDRKQMEGCQGRGGKWRASALLG